MSEHNWEFDTMSTDQKIKYLLSKVEHQNEVIRSLRKKGHNYKTLVKQLENNCSRWRNLAEILTLKLNGVEPASNRERLQLVTKASADSTTERKA